LIKQISERKREKKRERKRESNTVFFNDETMSNLNQMNEQTNSEKRREEK